MNCAPPAYARQDKWVGILVWALALALFVFLLSSCSALRKNLWTGGGAAGGAAIGAVAGGPVGAAVGGAVGAIGVGAVAESQELRDGDLVGDAALVKQAALWRAEAISNRKAVEDVDWLSRVLKWGAGLVALWFAWRNREHLNPMQPNRLRRLAHAIFGPAPKLLRKRA